MSEWANGDGFTSLEDVFTSRDFGRPAEAAAAAPVAKAAPRAGRAHLLTNRAIAILSVGAAALSVVATLAVNAGGPSLTPVVSAEHAPNPPPDSLTPVPGSALGGLGTSGGAGTTGTSAGGHGANGSSAGATGGAAAGNGAAGAASGTTTVVALGTGGASASLTDLSVSHPAPHPPPPTTTTTTQPPPISAGGNGGANRDNGNGNGGQNNGRGNANGVQNSGGNGNGNSNGHRNGGGGGVVILSAVTTSGVGRGRG